MSIIQGNTKSSESTFYPKVINGSLRFNDDDSAYLSWTPASAGDRKTWTWSGWVKRGNLSSGQRIFHASTDSNNRTEFYFRSDDQIEFFSAVGGVHKANIKTNAKFRDPSAWYHLVVVLDAVNTSLNIYVNGVLQTLTTTTAVVNTNQMVNATNVHTLGRYNPATSSYLDAYLANVHFIDGQALTADDFGETKNGVWVAKDYAGTFGTNGFYLTFEDDTEVEAFNTVIWSGTGSGTDRSYTGVGFSPDLIWTKRRDGGEGNSNHQLLDTVRGARNYLASNATSAEGNDISNGIISSFDADGFTWQYGTQASYQDFYYDASGGSYVAWCWDAGANNAVTGHSSVTWSGSSATQRISGLPFSPDLVWIKARNVAYGSQLFDSVRGANKRLSSNVTNAEVSDTDALMSFDSNGFILGAEDGVNDSTYTYVGWAWDAGDGDPVSNTTGDITSTVKASTTNGFSIVSWTGNQTAGATIGHGLSSAPDFIIFKNRNDASDWPVYHTSLGTDYAVYLNTTGAQDNRGVGFLNSTAPSSSVISLHTWNLNNGSGDGMIAYCFHDVTGKQKFGTYTGNGSTSGPTVTTGFRPGWLMIKRTDSTNNWFIYDGSRNPLNPIDTPLNANSSSDEATIFGGNEVEFSDTGFQLIDDLGATNASGGTYIYAAFAGSYSDYITDYNTDGSIDSRVKANPTTGFSIVSYTGDANASKTIGHGLSTAPDMIIVKGRNVAQNWVVYHSANTGSPETQRLYLDGTNATDTVAWWNNTAPTSSVFSVSNFGGTGGAYNYIAYCWTETTGYSKFGSYSGGTLGYKVTTGFKPAFVLIKRTNSNTDWFIIDNTRDTDSIAGKRLKANDSVVELDIGTSGLTILSDGFEIENTSDGWNASGGTYIYAAFADTREAAFWLDQSGNDNDWQPVNLDHNDTVSDSPTDNFCTWNPLNKGTNLVTSDGNLSFNNSTTETTHRTCVATHGMTSGKYYWEVVVDSTTNVDMIGIVGQNATLNSGHVGTSGFGYGYSTANGNWYKASGWADDGTTPPAFPTGGTIGIAFDADNKKIYFSRNGVWINNANPTAGTGANGTYTGSETVFFPAGSRYYNTGKWVANFGQQPFKYDPPE